MIAIITKNTFSYQIKIINNEWICGIGVYDCQNEMQIVQSLRLVSSARLLFTYRVGTWLSPWRAWLNTKTTVPVVVRRKLIFSPKSGQNLLQFIDKKQKSVQAFMCLTCSINIWFFLVSEITRCLSVFMEYYVNKIIALIMNE